jgi:HD superfamily phosphohydrolase
LHNYSDPLYGTWSLPSGVAQLVACPTFQRLRGVNQSGASKYADPLRTVTRFEHSIGVYLLLRHLGAAEEEQVAGLLHDISHTAFSHVADIVYYSPEQAFHEDLKAEFLNRPDLRAALGSLGYKVQDFLSDEPYPLLEQPLPALCADRIDYSLRDAVTMGEISIPAARAILADHVVHDGRLAMRTPALARQFADLFREMNDTYWAAQKENYLYEMLARAIEIGMSSRVLDRSDLLADDDTVEAILRAAGDPRIEALFGKLVDPPAAEIAAFVPPRPIKQRAIDPLVLLDRTAIAISRLGCG